MESSFSSQICYSFFFSSTLPLLPAGISVGFILLLFESHFSYSLAIGVSRNLVRKYIIFSRESDGKWGRGDVVE